MKRVLLAALLLSTGCAAGSADVDSGELSSTRTVPAGTLPTGKADLPVAGLAYSPLDFVPPLRLTVPAGWISTHRGDDAFDLSRPDPTKDAPLVVVAFITPDDATAADALETLRARLGPGQAVSGTVGEMMAQGFDVVGGTGLLVESPVRTVTLDRTLGQRARILALDLDEVPLLVVIAVPDGTEFHAVLPDVDKLLAGVVQG